MDMHLKNLFARFQEQFGSGPGLGPGSGTCLMKVEGIAPPFIKSLYRAAAALYRTDPWKRLRPGHHFGIRVGKDSDWSSKKQPFPCIQFIGGDGGDLGLYMFRSEKDARKMTGSRETIRVPNVELLRVTYELESLMFPSNKRMIRLLSLEISGTNRFPVIDQDDGVGPKWSREVYFEPFIETVDVQWPPEMAKGSDLVAVTVSHPPGQGYEERAGSTASSTPTKNLEPNKEESFGDIKVSSGVGSRVCEMCEKEVHGEQSVCCNKCWAVIYCSALSSFSLVWLISRANGSNHWKFIIKACGGGSVVAIPTALMVCFPLKVGLWDTWGGLEDDEYPRDLPLHDHLRDGLGISGPILLSGWSEYYNLRNLSMSSPVADILSHPLTVYYILTALIISSKNLLLKGKEVILHYLGPEGELDWMPAFAEIGHLLNGMGNIQIVIVGPGVPANLSGTTSGISSRVRVNLVRGLYQEEATYLTSPHAIVALNCALEKYASWGGALDLIKSMGVPAFFTDQSEISCANAKQVLRSAGLHITQPVTPNPFRSPVRNQGSSSNLPSYSNGFVFGVNT
ncbi:hypothetical protein Acr_00g0006640 [Actinidia rufa]|uniref:Mitochondrial splicing suppressor 51-like C-terminal domain-containing protein n=1 Tax=Actinidia rufa TaxID=165716 RepID=A0A7J0D837_9ERIC|nr:hypothetical protein Acr_00g0006640 [Actinidia rufa]